jgi:hypothetical protein
MQISGFTKAGSNCNEDVYEITSNYGFVLDGATGLLKTNITTENSEAQWFVKEWKRYLNQHITSYDRDLKDILKQGVKEVSKKYMSFTNATQQNIPSCSAAIYRIFNNVFEYFVLGDSSLIITKNDNSLIQLQAKQITKFDEENINIMKNIAQEKGINIIDARQLMNNHLMKVRLTKNTEQGYWVLSDSVEAIDKGIHGTVNVNEIKKLVALSDGFSQIYDTLDIYTIEEFIEQVSTDNVQKFYNILRSTQEKDKYWNKYPRFKLSDDATIIVMA